MIVIARDFSRKFYASKAWETTREAYLISKFFLCERCGNTANTVHHKVWLSPENIGDINITLGWDNLEAICDSCHHKEHYGEVKVCANDVMFDEYGNLVRK